ncbi:hypothetical protein BDQ17DRAFT_1330342 [Cyathus striatus]|nr:hypothetical protein BDQ17DRAFT_1330342 [Cyathus striatus]
MHNIKASLLFLTLFVLVQAQVDATALNDHKATNPFHIPDCALECLCISLQIRAPATLVPLANRVIILTLSLAVSFLVDTRCTASFVRTKLWIQSTAACATSRSERMFSSVPNHSVQQPTITQLCSKMSSVSIEFITELKRQPRSLAYQLSQSSLAYKGLERCDTHVLK